MFGPVDGGLGGWVNVYMQPPMKELRHANCLIWCGRCLHRPAGLRRLHVTAFKVAPPPVFPPVSYEPTKLGRSATSL